MLTEAKVILCKWHRKFQVVVRRGNLFFKLHNVTKCHNRKTYLYLYIDINISVFLSVSSRKKWPVGALGYLSLLLDFTYSVVLNFHILINQEKKKGRPLFGLSLQIPQHRIHVMPAAPLKFLGLRDEGVGDGWAHPLWVCEQLHKTQTLSPVE